MDPVFTDFRQQITDRWLALLALPSVPFAATALTAWQMAGAGPSDALNLATFTSRLHSGLILQWDDPARRTALILCALISSAILSAAVNAFSAALVKLWLGTNPLLCRALSPLTARRARLLERDAPTGYEIPKPYRPERATWIGDRFLLTDRRIRAQYGVTLARAWPRLWQLSSEQSQQPVQNALDAYVGASVQVAWSLGYIILGILWWPATLIGIAVLVGAWRRARSAAADLAANIEAFVDVTVKSLAETLGVDLPHGRVTALEGEAIEGLLDKGSLRWIPQDSE
jgi:hypothetical protein